MLPRIRPFAPVVTSLAMLGLASAVQAEPKMYTGSIILHDFANDTTSGSTPPYSTATHLALPLGAHCNPANGGKTCGKATLHGGAPLLAEASAPLRGSAPPLGFVIRKGDFFRKVTGSLSPYPGISYTVTSARLENEGGQLDPGGGPGSFTFVPKLGLGSTRIAVEAGKNRFGGVLRLAGRFGTHNAGKTLGGGRWYGDFPDWGVRVVGASHAEMTTVGGTFRFTSPPLEYKSVAVVTGFPWTTGRVSVSAAGDFGFPTRLVRSGYDKRTLAGAGTIQLVTPRLTHWAGGAHWGDIAVMRIQFAPEPEGWLLLATGLCLLAVLHHSGAGRARRNKRAQGR